MTEFERVLQECLHDLEEGSASIDECLARHPRHARQLEPVLLTSAYLARGREARISDAFKRRVRSRLIQEMYARPRRPVRSMFPFMRLATGFAVILLALLATGIVYAQSALPGNLFYEWKLASENVWRVVSPDPVATELAIAERRLQELIAVRDQPALYAQARIAYLEVIARLQSEMSAEDAVRVAAALAVQAEVLAEAGISLEQPDPAQSPLPASDDSTLTPAATPLPSLQTPPVNPTGLPTVIPSVNAPVPTLEIPPAVLPTAEEPSESLPTLELTVLVP